MRNPFFPLTILAGSVFTVTVLASVIGATVGEQRAPVNQFLNNHGDAVLLVEVVMTLSFGFLALVVDRWQTVRELNQGAVRPTPPPGEIGANGSPND